MELHEENSFKVRSMQNAAFNVERFPFSLEGKNAEELAGLEGIGKGTAARILELHQRGSFDELDQWLATTPTGVVAMMAIKGIGPKKVKALWKELGIESPGELLYACHENRLIELKGFGIKTQDQIRQSIEFARSNQGKFHYAICEAEALRLTEDIRESRLATRCEITGALRRKNEIIEEIILLIASETQAELIAFLKNHPAIEAESFSQDGNILHAILGPGSPLECKLISSAGFDLAWFDSTASTAHRENLERNVSWNHRAGNTEQEIYRSLGLPYLEPEWREGMFEWDWIEKGKLPEPIEYTHLQGTLHNHTTYSDGIHTLREMAVYAKAMGFHYLGICDHSQSAFYANGLKPDRVLAQQEEIDRLNAELAPFRIFKGIESDILTDGSLDYPDEVLRSFDFVVASVHSVLRMDEEKATKRLLKAIENPYTTILGHPTGRLLLARSGYPLDMKKIIDACAANGVIIELNANPYRLDLDWRHIPYAQEKGVLISINPDAHRQEGYHDMHYGVCVARKGGLEVANTFNAWSLDKVATHFKNRKG